MTTCGSPEGCDSDWKDHGVWLGTGSDLVSPSRSCPSLPTTSRAARSSACVSDRYRLPRSVGHLPVAARPDYAEEDPAGVRPVRAHSGELSRTSMHKYVQIEPRRATEKPVARGERRVNHGANCLNSTPEIMLSTPSTVTMIASGRRRNSPYPQYIAPEQLLAEFGGHNQFGRPPFRG